MSTWSVTARGASAVQVRGRNWIVALGRGLAEMGRVDDLTRLACEVLPNGTVIARDIATGTGYVVQEVDGVDPLEPDYTEEIGRVASPPPREQPRPATSDDEDDTVQGELPRIDLANTDFSFLEPEDKDDGTEGDEETAASQIFDLPLDAISELSVDENPKEAIRAADTPANACRLALEAARAQIPAEAGAVILEERGYLRFLAVDGPASKKLTGVRLPRGTGVAGYAMAKQKTVVLANAHDDPRHCGEVDALTGYMTREICVVPVTAGDKVLGVLELMNLPAGRRFGDADVAVMESLANALSQRLSH